MAGLLCSVLTVPRRAGEGHSAPLRGSYRPTGEFDSREAGPGPEPGLMQGPGVMQEPGPGQDGCGQQEPVYSTGSLTWDTLKRLRRQRSRGRAGNIAVKQQQSADQPGLGKQSGRDLKKYQSSLSVFSRPGEQQPVLQAQDRCSSTLLTCVLHCADPQAGGQPDRAAGQE